MVRIRPLVALLLAALWLPAVVHCAVELIEAGAEISACCDHANAQAPVSEDGCVVDHCDVFEEGRFLRETAEEVLVSPIAPSLFMAALEAWTLQHRGDALDATSISTPEPADARRWAFSVRAVAWANAPGLSND